VPRATKALAGSLALAGKPRPAQGKDRTVVPPINRCSNHRPASQRRHSGTGTTLATMSLLL